MSTNKPIPLIDVLPPIAPRPRQFLYGTLAWVAGLLTIASAVIALVPEWDLSRPMLIANVVVNGLWTLLGFKAGDNVSDRKV